jgi:hypothetical protein
MGTRLMNQEDFDAVRALLLPLQSPANQVTILPNTTIQLASVGGRAEALVITRLGLDWQLFALYPNATIPAYYAQGDPITALGLVHDALVQFSCMQLIALGFAQQLVPIMTRTADQQQTLAIKWDQRRQDFAADGYAALYLLRRPQPVAGRSFISPSAGASGQMGRTIATRHPWRDRRWATSRHARPGYETGPTQSCVPPDPDCP